MRSGFKGGLALGIMLALSMRAGWAGGIEAFWIPALSISAGYEDNRFLAAGEVGDGGGGAFLRAEPSLGLRALAGEDWEFGLALSHARTEYADADLEHRTETVARGDLWHAAPGWEGGVSVDAGWAEDVALPDDDQHWIGLMPVVDFFLPEPSWILTARGRLAWTTYDHLVARDGGDLQDTLIQFRPGLRWVATRETAAWMEAYVETDAANDETQEFDGVGGALRVDHWVTPQGRLSVWAEAGLRWFADPGLDGVAAREDQPVDLGASYVHRFLPGLELAASCRYRATHSTWDEGDLSAWFAQLGVRLVDERPLR